MVNTYTDAYGLKQGLGSALGVDLYNQARLHNSGSAEQEMIVPVKMVGTVLNPSFNKDDNNDGTLDSFGVDAACLPDNCLIKSADLVVKTAISGIVAQTVNIGLYKADGTAIDADGLFAALAAADLGAVGITAGAGALIGTKITDPAFVKATPSAALTGVTGGDAYIVIKYYI